MNSNSTLREVLCDLASYLRFRWEEGEEFIELDSETAAALDNWLGRRLRPPEPKSSPTSGGAGLTSLDGAQQLRKIAEEISKCTRCPLHATRTSTVPGQGAARCRLMFVGEGPGEDEDMAGQPFVGAAGQLLTRMIAAMGFTRDEVFISNIVKCRPPHNRIPLPDEIEACLPFLRSQIRIVKPEVIVALGATAAKALLGVASGITSLRGKWHQSEGIPVMPTFHPSYLLRSPSQKKYVWEDLKEVLRRLGLPVPGEGKR